MKAIPIGLLTDGEQLLLKRSGEWAARAEDGAPAFSHFLTPREQRILEGLMPSSDVIRFFWGGYEDAERRILCFLPSYYEWQLDEDPTGTPPSDSALASLVEEELEGQMCALYVESSGYVKLAHRDYMGALLGLGIERERVGDILADDGGAIVFLHPSVRQLLKNELHTVGRDTVKVRDFLPPEGFSYTRTFDDISGTVASARLDAVIAELGRISREKAKELILAGFAEHNYFPASKPDAEVQAGDRISMRHEGKCRGGKFIIDSLDERSQKGRIRLKARKYL